MQVLAALGGVVEGQQPVAGDVHVLLAHRGKAVRRVLGGVLLPADAEETQVQQAYGAGQHPVFAEAFEGEVSADALAGRGQLGGEVEDAVVLGEVALQPPGVVVAVLPAASGVHTGGLDVA